MSLRSTFNTSPWDGYCGEEKMTKGRCREAGNKNRLLFEVRGFVAQKKNSTDGKSAPQSDGWCVVVDKSNFSILQYTQSYSTVQTVDEECRVFTVKLLHRQE